MRSSMSPARARYLVPIRWMPIESCMVRALDQLYITEASYSDEAPKFDTNFQGYGRFLTSSTGEYYFRTIMPAPYRGRPAAHIHARIWKVDRKMLTTECF